MKKNAFFTFSLLLSVVIVYAQESIEPTIIIEGRGTVTFEDGEIKTGFVQRKPSSPRNIWFKEDGEKDGKVNIRDITGFTIGEQVWVKVINKGAIGTNSDYLMERLTPEERAISVYLDIQQNSIGNDQGFKVTRAYYVKTEEWDEVYSVGTMRLTPFHKKGIALVEDCPSLSKKIAKKQDGYKVGLISSDLMKAEVFLRISEEYANCN